MPVFIALLSTYRFNTRMFPRPPRGRRRAHRGLGIREVVVLHEALDVAVEGEVVAPEFPLFAVLLHRHHVERRAPRAPFLGDADGLPALGDGLDQLPHDGVVAPPGHGQSTFEISLRNCSFDFVCRILSMSSSSAAAGSRACSTRRR